MRTRQFLAALLLIPVIALTGCTTPDPDPPTAAAAAGATPVGTKPTPQTPTPAPTTGPIKTEIKPDKIIEEPAPPVPVSKGPVNLSGYTGPAKAKLLILESHKITAIALDGSILHVWDLPGDLRTLLEGITQAIGYAPTLVDHGPYMWDYDWGGFTISDFSPSVVEPGDPPYKFTASVRGIGVTQFRTVGDIGVGDPASMATALADEVLDGSGRYWSTVDSFRVAVPGYAEPRIYVEISAPSGTSSITGIRGPTGSWTS